MWSPVVREAAVPDAPAVVALQREVHPYLVRGIASTAQLIRHPPVGKDWKAFVAEVDGQVVGWVSASRNSAVPGNQMGQISLLQVKPDKQGQGIGSELLSSATAHLDVMGMTQLRAFVREPSLPFARHRGFEPSRSAQWATISLSEVRDAPLAVPSGIEVVTFADLDPQSVYIADGLVSADEPNDVPTAPQSYEAWTQDVWLNPDIDYSCSVACVEGAVVVALSIVLRDGDRVWSDMTGTIRSHRGRGLAFLAKSSALRHAAEAGATYAFTGVDSENAAMLAINHRLGYRTVDTMWSCLKSL